MNILFVYSVQNSIRQYKPLRGQEEIQFGISYISSVLKKNGHTTRLIVMDRRYGIANQKLAEKIIGSFKPSMMCFTAVNSEFSFIRNIAVQLKHTHPDIFFCLGGIHATLAPEEEWLDTFDALCIGEGELPVSELADRIEFGGDITSIANLWIKTNGRVKKNNPRPYLANLDELPFPDREMWQEWIVEKNTRLTVLLGRGCPFNCSYCCNHKLRTIAEGNYVRLRNPEYIIEEMKQCLITFHGVNEFFFEVETLGTDTRWLKMFCCCLEIFNAGIDRKMHYCSNIRIHPQMNFDDVFRTLSKAGFGSVTMGLESGSERIRNKILNRHYSNDDLLIAARSAKIHKIKVGLFNMIGIPGETYEDFLKTLEMNRTIQPHWHSTSIFFPYSGTELYDRAKSMGLIPSEPDTRDERQKAILDLPGFPKKLIQKSFDRFHFDVYKKYDRRSRLKLLLYRIQIIAGHHFMSTAKRSLIRILSYGKLNLLAHRLNLFGVFQKTSL